MKISRSKILTLIMAAAAAWLILTSCSTGISKGWYSYKQIRKAGYDCKPFKGRHYIRPTKDTSIVDIKPIKP